MSNRAWRRLLMVLLAITGIALAWNRWGMDDRLVIDADSRWPVLVTDDRDLEGGNSVAVLRREGRQVVLDCHLGAGYQYRFCELQFGLGEAPQGLDLSHYDTIEIVMSARAAQAAVPVRVFIRSFHPRYSALGDEGSLKVHEITFTPADYRGALAFPLSQIGVASWWVDEHPLPLEFIAQDLTHVVSLSVATAGKVDAGLHTLAVERIELHGKWISAGTLGLGLVGMWAATMLVCLVIDSLAARRHLRRSSALQTSLRRLNATLQSQANDLARQARQDALSGALNRHGLTEALIGQTRLGDAALFPAALVFIDIDHFKQINDRHGHAVGDEVIRGLAELVRAQVQREDLLARWGGEEFLLLCQATPMAEAYGIAERLRQAVAQADWPARLQVSCSFGVAEWSRGQDLDDAIRRADEAMYQAKRQGRDRVVCAVPLG
ncbi:GGDEF domain-containing protein [Ideonella sp. DXS29W]|uniref:diguanylate cyclase n=1 Tax=Ideonella lacteola TaxID=2984193 RepID=A0ABU9BQ62_9BURK